MKKDRNIPNSKDKKKSSSSWNKNSSRVYGKNKQGSRRKGKNNQKSHSKYPHSNKSSTKNLSKILGKVIHIVNDEAIVHPPLNMPKSGNIAILDDRVIGTVRHPIGRVEDPYIPIVLNQLGRKLQNTIVGQVVLFAYRPKKKGMRRSANN